MDARRVGRVCYLISIFALLCALCGAASASGELPLAIADSLEQLRMSFDGMAGSIEPGMMPIEIKRNGTAISEILGYAASSSANSETLADALCAPLDAFAERFGPGTQINEETLAKTKGWRGTEPDYGLNVDAYLLLETVKERRSASSAREALVTLHEVVLAKSYLARSQLLYRMPEAGMDIAREETESGGYGTTLGAEIAWCCEQYLIDPGLTTDPYLSSSALSVVALYRSWRKEALAERMIQDETRPLPISYQHRTMDYIRRLVEVLPDEVVK